MADPQTPEPGRPADAGRAGPSAAGPTEPSGAGTDHTGQSGEGDPLRPRDASRTGRPGGASRTGRPAGWRAELLALLELVAVSGFVVVQPVLEVTGGSPDFFIFHGVTGAEIMLMVALFALVPPLALWGLGLLAGLVGRRVRVGVHLVSIGLLLSLLLIEVGKATTPVRGLLLAGLAALVGSVIVAGYVRFDAFKHLLRFAAIGPLVFVLLFAFTSPASTVVLGAGGSSTAAAAEVTGPHPPIVVIVFDEFPLLSLLDGQGNIDADRFPNFARLAAESTWYRNATSVASWTPQAMPAMMTGRYPVGNVAGHYAVFPENLFTLLGDVYEVYAIETVTHLCPPWTCGERAGSAHGGFRAMLRDSTVLVGEIVSPYDPNRDPTTGMREPTLAELDAARAAAQLGPEFLFDRARAENRPARFEQYLARLAASGESGQPTLDLLHLLIPHSPWTYLPSGTQYRAPHLPLDGPWFVELAHQRHLLQVEYADRLLGEVLQVLDQTGRYHESLVVVTSDHGHSFTPGSAGRNLDETGRGLTELAWVPLFIKAPGQTVGVVDDRNWQHVDLMPTIAEHAGVRVPWPVDGLSALSGVRDSDEKLFYDSLDLAHPVRFETEPHLGRVRGEAGPVPPLSGPPRPDLIGASVPVTAVPLAVDLDDPAAYREVSPGREVPALVLGTVRESVTAGTLVAVSVNGRVGAVAPVIRVGDDRRVAALIPDEDLFRPGENRIAFYLVADIDGRP